MVMDMDPGRLRQPWFVMASEWPTDDGEIAKEGDEDEMDIEEMYTWYADKRVLRDNPQQQYGIFPGDKNRTPICEIQPLEASTDERPVLQRLGPFCDFKPVRQGSRTHAMKPSRWGPDLPRPMIFLRDRTKEHDVCFDANGEEYMCYDVKQSVYHYPNVGPTSSAGEQGMFGELVPGGKADQQNTDAGDMSEWLMVDMEGPLDSKKLLVCEESDAPGF